MPPNVMKRSSRAGTPKPGQPVSDAATYRDLLLFEERLKTNAARLNRRKRKYQCMLFNSSSVGNIPNESIRMFTYTSIVLSSPSVSTRAIYLDSCIGCAAGDELAHLATEPCCSTVPSVCYT